MEAIREVFSKPIDRRIEEVIKVDQADEKTVLDELQEYVITVSIGDHFITVYKAIADAPSDPHEGIGIWVSGFFGSGKSSFAKILGYTVGGRTVGGQSASQLVQDKARQELPKSQADTLAAYLGVINANIPTQAIIFDVSMDRGVRTANERLTEIMYKALLRELGYAEDFDLAELEMSLEADALLETFRKEFQRLHNKRWEERRKLGRGINEASAVLHRLDPDTYTSADSWARSLGQGRADITPNLLAERAFELARRRRPGNAVLFIIDEVGQYVSRSVDKMLDLQAVVQAFGREGKNRVSRKQATAPCWLVVTSQEKLHEVVDALDSKKIELARLQEIFADPTIRGYRYQNRKAFPLSLTIDGEVLEGAGQLPLELLLADNSEDFEATCEDARRASNENRHELFWTCALTEEAHRYIEELYSIPSPNSEKGQKQSFG